MRRPIEVGCVVSRALRVRVEGVVGMSFETGFVFAFVSLFGFTLQLDAGLVSPEAATSLAPSPAETAALAAPPASAPPAAAPVPTDTSAGVRVAADLARRARMGKIHRSFGIATWGAMTSAVVLGSLQYANLYGFGADASQSRCVHGNAFFGQKACSSEPLPHLLSATLTAALYYTTFGLSYAMPDPVGLDRGSSPAARHLRTHKILRWAHFAGMAAQMVLGLFTAHASDWLHLDRANDYGALRALATTHLAIGYATYGLLTWAGALMIR